MDKLQKFFKGIWRFKERIVLAVLVGFLCFRVYELFVPNEFVEAKPDEVGTPPPPPPPPNRPAIDPPGQYATLHRSNAFSFYSDAPTDGSGDLTGKEAGIELVDIQDIGGRLRARLKTTVARKWYDVGEEFEEFKVESINPEEKTVVVYATRFARTVTLRLP